MEISHVIIGAVAGAIGLLITKIASLISKIWETKSVVDSSSNKDNISKNESDSKLTSSEMQQALLMYKDLIIDLRKDMKEIGDNTKEMEKIYLEARIENASLKEQLQFCKDRVMELLKK